MLLYLTDVLLILIALVSQFVTARHIGSILFKRSMRGDDSFGSRPQHGIVVVRVEMDALSFQNGVAVAVDDVNGHALGADVVR